MKTFMIITFIGIVIYPIWVSYKYVTSKFEYWE